LKEKLIIKNFGPIKNVELELGRFNVLIGEQATGKSTVAKVLAVCRYFSYIINGYNLSDPFLDGLLFWRLSNAVKLDTYIYYQCLDYSLTAERTGYNSFPAFSSILKPISAEFKYLLSELDSVGKRPTQAKDYNFSTEGWRIPTSFFLNDVARIMNNPFYLPTERGLQSIFSLGKNPDISDSLFSQLAKIRGITDNWFNNNNNDTAIEPLDITYRIENGVGKVRKNTEDNFSILSNAASGYQSAVPIVLSLKYYSEIKNKQKTFLIEEPELNLFPEAQNKLMQYLADKTINYNNQLLLTTHSPYILTSLNNLMYAYQVGQEHAEEVNKIIDKKYWVNPNDVSAYRLMTDGTAKNILDDELKQIDAGELDGISRSINDIWDKIANIEYSTSHEH